MNDINGYQWFYVLLMVQPFTIISLALPRRLSKDPAFREQDMVLHHHPGRKGNTRQAWTGSTWYHHIACPIFPALFSIQIHVLGLLVTKNMEVMEAENR